MNKIWRTLTDIVTVSEFEHDFCWGTMSHQFGKVMLALPIACVELQMLLPLFFITFKEAKGVVISIGGSPGISELCAANSIDLIASIASDDTVVI